ncbi:MAG: chromate transporter [Candidatus Entotheonellia bacterium]
MAYPPEPPHAAGLGGALVATPGVFLMPWVLAAAAAQQLQRFLQHPWMRGFGRRAAPAVVGLLGVTALMIARHRVTYWSDAVMAVAGVG